MRVAVVGIGYWGSKHVRVLHNVEEVTQVIAVDGDPERRSSIEAAFPRVRTASSLTEVLDDCDGVVIATPPTSHVGLGLQAIEAGKHVLIEKPLATNSADARALVDAAERRGVTLMVGHTFEYNAAVVRLRELIQAGELGVVHYIDSARLNLGLYQPDVNVLWDLAPHDISICNYVLDDTPTAVSAWGSAHANGRFEDVAALRLHYEASGVIANIRVSWLDPNKVRTTTVVGSRRMAVYNDLNDNERIKVYDRGVAVEQATDQHNMPMSYRYGDIVAPHVDFPEPLTTEARDFVHSALAGRSPRASGYKGLAVVETLEAADLALTQVSSVPVGSTLAPIAIAGS